MFEITGLTGVDTTNQDNFAIYEQTFSSGEAMELKTGPSLPFPFRNLITTKELWFFFKDKTDFVKADIKAGWSDVEPRTPDKFVTGGIMYAFGNYYKKDLPQLKDRHLDGTPGYYLGKNSIKLPKDSTGSLIINAIGITAVLIIVQELPGLDDNDITVNNVFYHNPNYSVPLTPGTPGSLQVEE